MSTQTTEANEASSTVTSQSGSISTDHGDPTPTTKHNQKLRKLLSSNTEVLSDQNPADSTSPTTTAANDKKKKNRTPPKSKYNANQHQQGYKHVDEESFGTKKGNLNHLLNFSYASTSADYEYQRFSKQFWTNKITKNSYFSKEQFMQANCQFVVKDSGDYSVNLVDPDLLVDWSNIEEIHMDSNEFISCPICLYPPNAGKMTKCGHIFCWPCILHYLSLSDKPWRKCPICYESIYKPDLKSVLQNKYVNDYKPNDLIQFELMFKSKTKLNTIILPYTLIDQFKADSHKLNSFNAFASDETYTTGRKYLKIISRPAVEIFNSILERERRQLMKQLEEDKDQPEVCFVQEALELLAQRETCLKAEPVLKTPTSKSNNDQVKAQLTESVDKLSLAETFEEPAVLQAKKTLTQQSTLNTNQDFVYFYQSSDGQRIYLNALNARMLMSEYSSFTNCPQNITARILASESFFMSEENRKRFRYLSHLPLHSEFRIVEVELNTEAHVSLETITLFEREIKEKRQLRERKLMKEKRLADRFDQANYEPHYYNSSAMNERVVDYTNDFPEASTSPASASSSGVSSGSSGGSVQASFAQMIKHPKNLVGGSGTSGWPALDEACMPVVGLDSAVSSGWLSAAKQGPVLGRSKKVQGPPSPWTKKNSMAAEYENEDAVDVGQMEHMPAPGFKESFFSGIDETLRVIDSKKMNDWEAMLLGEGKQGEDQEGKKCQQMSKKKKKTKQLLFCT